MLKEMIYIKTTALSAL